MLNLGVRAHDFGRLPAAELAEDIAKAGLSCVQLALPRALPGFEPAAGFVTHEKARRIAADFRSHGVSIAVLGCYINPVHPDPTALEASLLRFEELLRHGASFGCSIVATETGSLNPDCTFHPGTASEEVFDRLVASFRRLARSAEAEGMRIGVEGVARVHTVSTHDRMTRLLDAVGSSSLGVLYDPANFLAVEDGGRFEASVTDALDRFGSRLIAVHAKDCRVEAGVKTGDLLAGTGQVPYPMFLERLVREHPGVPILLEDVTPQTVGTARDYLLRCLGR